MGQRQSRPIAHPNVPISVVKGCYDEPRVRPEAHRQPTRPTFVTPNESNFSPSGNGRNGWKYDEIYEKREAVCRIDVFSNLMCRPFASQTDTYILHLIVSLDE
jgi:hypothetical protein